MAAPAREKLITSEFYDIADTTDERLELIEGEIVVMPPPVPVHQAIIFNAGFMIRSMNIGGKVYLSPIEVELDEENAPQPDLLWIAPSSTCRVGDKRLYGAPDLIVEVFSPRTAKNDLKGKFELYQRAGVREYWMIHPIEEYVEVHSLVEGKYQRLGVFGVEDSFVSPVLNGLTISVSPIFQP